MARCGNGTCVEVAEKEDGVTLTSSTPGNNGSVTYTYDEWRVFLELVKTGEFDSPE